MLKCFLAAHHQSLDSFTYLARYPSFLDIGGDICTASYPLALQFIGHAIDLLVPSEVDWVVRRCMPALADAVYGHHAGVYSGISVTVGYSSVSLQLV